MTDRNMEWKLKRRACWRQNARCGGRFLDVEVIAICWIQPGKLVIENAVGTLASLRAIVLVSSR